MISEAKIKSFLPFAETDTEDDRELIWKAHKEATFIFIKHYPEERFVQAVNMLVVHRSIFPERHGLPEAVHVPKIIKVPLRDVV